MSAAAIARDAGVFRQIILPDLLVVAPTGITDQQLTRLSKITSIRHMIAFDGAEIKAGNRAVNVIGVNPATFRSWVPLQTASIRPSGPRWRAGSSRPPVRAQEPRSC